MKQFLWLPATVNLNFNSKGRRMKQFLWLPATVNLNCALLNLQNIKRNHCNHRTLSTHF